MGRVRTIARRSFLIGSAAIAGGVVFGVYAYRKDLGNPLEGAAGAVPLNPYVIITAAGVTVITPRAEMGQGVQTTLAALVAEELDLPWSAVTAEHGPPSPAYHNSTALMGALPFADYKGSRLRDVGEIGIEVASKTFGFQITGGSSSMRDAYVPLRTAGAAARHCLMEAAAQRLNLPRASLMTKGGFVLAPDGTQVSYGDLAEDAARIEPPQDPPLKSPANWTHLGTSKPRLDIGPKVTGAAEFGSDIRLDGMLFAAIRATPRLGGQKEGHDSSAAEAMPGVERVIDLGDAVAVVARNTWIAMQAVEAVDIAWGPAPYPATTDGIFDAIAAAFDRRANTRLRNDGDVEAALAEAERTGEKIAAEYRLPYLAHTAMEPHSATAVLQDGHLTIWVSNQDPVTFQRHIARAIGLKPKDITLHTPLMGGSFGRRAETDIAVQAARIAADMPGRPVKLTWSREEDTRHGFYRPGAILRMSGVAGSNGPIALAADVAAPSTYRQQAQRKIGFSPPGPDRLLVEGLFDQPYAIPNYRTRGYIADVAVPVGNWRSVGYSHNSFAHECFLDELAHAKGLDPVETRLALLQDSHPASHRVVATVAEMADWGGPRAEGTGLGVAFAHSFGSPTAHIIEVRQTGAGVKIARAWSAVDVGTALDPRNVEAQLFGALIYGLSAAVMGEITFEDGEVVESNFDDYDALRMYQTPKIETRVLQSGEHLGGAGEPGTPPAAPALANAIFDLTGKRLRSLPLRNHIDFA